MGIIKYANKRTAKICQTKLQLQLSGLTGWLISPRITDKKYTFLPCNLSSA
jgi:hypothetical protein